LRAVFDANVLVAALLAPSGLPARLLTSWLMGDFELVVSEKLLEELERALGYPKVRAHVDDEDANELLALLRVGPDVVDDPPAPPSRSPDPGDDYILSLAETSGALVVSGDKHLLSLAHEFPVRTPRAFFELLGESRG
jgi:putative PIN family toxin of toxin-antitoxin system